jgi:gliding motility-associated-like protein
MSISADIVLEDLVAPNATVIFLNTSDYDDVSKRCEWHFDDGTIVKNCDELIEHIYTEAGCYEPFLIVMNRDLPECRDTARLETCVFVDNASKLEVPNVFSPNADGINDFFQVKAQTLRTFSGVIVNRWGRTVFEWTNWEDYEAGWDGKLSGGTDASPGVYYYVITAEGMDDAPYEIQGALHLMRE